MTAEPELISLPEAARRLGISRQRLHVLVQEGRVKATWIGNRYVLAAAAIERLKEVGW